jgi:hypothetical protein
VARKKPALGSYPAVSLTEVRKARDRAKVQRAAGVDPIEARKVQRLKVSNPTGDPFHAVAQEWLGKQAPQWSPGHGERSRRQLERDLHPWLGDRRLVAIEPVELLAALRRGALADGHIEKMR